MPIERKLSEMYILLLKQIVQLLNKTVHFFDTQSIRIGYWKIRAYIIKMIKYIDKIILKINLTNFYINIIKSNYKCFDVGANIGTYSEVFLKLCKICIAIEPNKELINIIKKNNNKLIKRGKLQLIQAGLGSVCGEKDFFISSSHTISSFSKEWVEAIRPKMFSHTKIVKTEKVQMLTLDYIIENNFMPNYIKMDIEGYELEAIKGLSQYIDIISFEYTLPHLKQDFNDIILKIDSLGCYSFKVLVIGEYAFKYTFETKDELLEKVNLNKITGVGDLFCFKSSI